MLQNWYISCKINLIVSLKMYTIAFTIYLSALLLLCDTSEVVEQIRRCNKNVTVENKFYTVLNREFNTTVTVISRLPGPSGTKIITDESWDAVANIIRNTLTLQKNGRIVNYDNNNCTHSKKPDVIFDCKKSVEQEKIFYAGPVEEFTLSDGKKYIIFLGRSEWYAFQLVHDFIRCERKVWITELHNVIAYENVNKDDCYEDVDLSDYENCSNEILSILAGCA